MFEVTTSDHFLLVTWPCNALYFNKPYNPHCTYYILYPEPSA